MTADVDRGRGLSGELLAVYPGHVAGQSQGSVGIRTDPSTPELPHLIRTAEVAGR